jgi:hypothetical protein
MRFGIFDKFGAKNSVPVFSAFCQALRHLGFPYTQHDIDADVAVIWSTVWAGRMKHNLEIWNQFRGTGRAVIVLEVGMLQRGVTWKVGINGTGQGSYPVTNLDADRPRRLGMILDPWRQNGRDIVIFVQRSDSEQWRGQPATDRWLADKVARIRQHSDRPIVVRAHPRQSVVIPAGCRQDTARKIPGTYDSFDFDRAIGNAWACVNHNSGPGSQSIIRGIPAFVDSSSLAAPVGNRDLANIENPILPERDEWLVRLCHTEWSIDEIAQSKPLQHLLPSLQSL